MGDENPIRTLGDYSKPSHEGYRNTIELLVGKNGVPLRSDTTDVENWLVGSDAHSMDFGPRIQTNTLRISLNLWTHLTLTVTIGKERACVYFNFPYAIKLAIGLNAFQQDPSPHGRILLPDSLLNSFHREGPQNSATILLCSNNIMENLYLKHGLNHNAHLTCPPRSKLQGQIHDASFPKTSLQQPVVEIKPQQPEEPETRLVEMGIKDLHLNLPVLEVLAYAPIYNAILDKYVESLELGKNGSTFVQGETPAKMGDLGLFTLPCRLGDSKPFDTLADLGSCINIIPLYLFKKLNIGLLEETYHIFGLILD
ncbi:hypothetical protein Tco_1409465 [Tanacetum coccineum]